MHCKQVLLFGSFSHAADKEAYWRLLCSLNASPRRQFKCHRLFLHLSQPHPPGHSHHRFDERKISVSIRQLERKQQVISKVIKQYILLLLLLVFLCIISLIDADSSRYYSYKHALEHTFHSTNEIWCTTKNKASILWTLRHSNTHTHTLTHPLPEHREIDYLKAFITAIGASSVTIIIIIDIVIVFFTDKMSTPSILLHPWTGFVHVLIGFFTQCNQITQNKQPNAFCFKEFSGAFCFGNLRSQMSFMPFDDFM